MLWVRVELQGNILKLKIDYEMFLNCFLAWKIRRSYDLMTIVPFFLVVTSVTRCLNKKYPKICPKVATKVFVER